MMALCELPLECQLKPLFIACSSFVRDNGCVKNTAHSPDALHAVCLNASSGDQTQSTKDLVVSGVTLRVRLATCAVLTVCAMGLHGSALASDKSDHERARQAVQSGQVLPLARVLALIEREYPGQVLEVELEQGGRDRQWHYEIKLMQPDGRLSKLKIDARTGVLLQRKTR